MFNNIYSGKRVLITGHTGFKGAWLSIWLQKLGAEIIGFSNCVPTEPSIYRAANLSSFVNDQIGDIRDLKSLIALIEEVRPNFIFHLAAQAIVSTSYESPIETLSTNIMGTANLLEALRLTNYPCVAVIITSDKCYENVEWLWGYKETDQLGGKDIYSGSKGAAEIVFHSYFESFFKKSECNVRVATARAGNVIGGGDWAKDRVVADCMRNWSSKQVVKIRSPRATRPWQHVLEPLSGYLTLAAALEETKLLCGESFNFGPRSDQNRSVIELISDLSSYWNFSSSENVYDVISDVPFHEAGLLKLNCDKALFKLKWVPNLDYMECVKFVSEWYYDFYNKDFDIHEITLDQIHQYELIARNKNLIWAF